MFLGAPKQLERELKLLVFLACIGILTFIGMTVAAICYAVNHLRLVK